MEENKTATAVNMELYVKLKGIAHGDTKKAILSLSLLFMRRKELAKMLLKANLNFGDQPAIQVLEIMNQEIKKVLFL